MKECEDSEPNLLMDLHKLEFDPIYSCSAAKQ